MDKKLLTLFFLSGASALMQQLVWTRLPTLLFGSTTLAASTVLTALCGSRLERLRRAAIHWRGMCAIRVILRGEVAVLLAAALLAVAGANEARARPAAGSGCLEPASWYSPESGRLEKVAGAELLREIARRDVVLLGEQHDAADHHRWQLQTLAALQLLRPRMVIGFESFPRRVQPVLDRWIAAELSEKQFLEQTDWDKVWTYPAELYMPLFQFARLNRIPMVALNVERSLTEAIMRAGWEAVPEAQWEGVSRPAAPPPAHLDGLFEAYKQHAKEVAGRDGAASRDSAGFRNFVAAQTAWDRAMAEALARALHDGERDERPLVVGIMGSGHLRHGHGIPHQLRALGVMRVATLLPIDADAGCAGVETGLADALYSIARSPQDQAPRPRLGVRVQQSEDGVTLVDVLPRSLAEASGLKRGDRVLTIAGTAVSKASAVIAAVRAQPAGTWLPMRVRRGNKSLDIIVKFPREP